MGWFLIRVKWGALLIIVALMMIVVFQNLEPIEVTLLFATVTLPQAAVLTITLLVGFLLGLVANAWSKMRSWQKHRKELKDNKDSLSSP